MKKIYKYLLYFVAIIVAGALIWAGSAYYYFYHYNNLGCAQYSVLKISGKNFILKNACNNYDRIMGSSVYQVEQNYGIAMIFSEEKKYSFIGSMNPYQMDVVFVDKNFEIKSIENLRPYTDAVVSGVGLIVLELPMGSVSKKDIGTKIQMIDINTDSKK